MTRRKFGISEIPPGPITLPIGKETGNEVSRNVSPLLDINQSLNQIDEHCCLTLFTALRDHVSF